MPLILPKLAQRHCDRPDATLRSLKGRIAALEKHNDAVAHPCVPLGVAPLDTVLGGGVMRGAVHEIACAGAGHDAAATGFALALTALATTPLASIRREVLWIQHEFAALECGALYGPGVALHAAATRSVTQEARPPPGRMAAAHPFGFGLQHLIVLRVRHMRDALWAMEEGLKNPGVAVTIADVLDGGSAADATATRRLALAAAESGTIGLLLRAKPSLLSSVAATRWEVAPSPGLHDRHGGLGRPVFALTLTKNRRGPPGRWLIAWDHHEHAFAPSLALAAASVDRQARIVARAS